MTHIGLMVIAAIMATIFAIVASESHQGGLKRIFLEALAGFCTIIILAIFIHAAVTWLA